MPTGKPATIHPSFLAPSRHQVSRIAKKSAEADLVPEALSLIGVVLAER
jgi:hypothetical protein